MCIRDRPATLKIRISSSPKFRKLVLFPLPDSPKTSTGVPIYFSLSCRCLLYTSFPIGLHFTAPLFFRYPAGFGFFRQAYVLPVSCPPAQKITKGDYCPAHHTHPALTAPHIIRIQHSLPRTSYTSNARCPARKRFCIFIHISHTELHKQRRLLNKIMILHNCRFHITLVFPTL